MQRRSVLIEVSPSELRAAVVVRGRIVASRSIARWCPDWKDAWPAVLSGSAANLRSVIAELGAVGLPAVIFYAAPRGAAGVFSCPAAAGARGAESAARLALSDATEFEPHSNPTIIARLAADPASTGNAGEGPQIHTLAATDPESSVRAVTGLAAACGLSVEGVAPADAVALAATVATAIRASQSPGTAVVLRIGAWGCTIAAATAGRLRFVRQISVGTASLVTALTGELRSADGGGAAVTLDRSRAGELLSASGIPARGSIFDPATGLAAEAVLPLLQPVLQRCIVELKQSIRFGLPEADRTGARLVPAGPGSLVPNLAAVIAEQCGLTLADPQASVSGEALSAGSIEDYAAGALRGVDLLLPAEQADGRRLATIRRGMWIGVAAACAMATLDGISAWFELAGATVHRDRVRAAIADSSRVAEIGRTLADRETALSAARQRLAGLMTPGVRWDALLLVLASETPASIRLAGVDMRFEGSRPECRLRGRADPSAGTNATDALKSYMQRLAASPIVQSCTLGGARRAVGADDSGQEFEITIALVGLPPDLELTMSMEKGGRP